MKKNKYMTDKQASNLQKAIGVIVIIASVSLGLYLMDRFPGVQMAWRKGEGPPPTSLVNNEELNLVFVKDWSFPTGTQFENFEVGGLSALTYDIETKKIISQSDDRGGKGDPRFFRWNLTFEGQVELKLDSIQVLKNEKKAVYPERTIDPEGITWLEKDRILVSSEGEQEALAHHPPRLILNNARGEYLKDIPIPKVFWDEARQGSYGVRNNMGFEALTSDLSKRWVYVSTEAALAQDGPVAGFDQGSVIRIVEFDREGDEFSEVAQLVYKVEPIPDTAGKDVKLSVGMNGVSDFLALSQRTFLVMERAYLANRGKNINRLFLANCLNASDVKDVDSLVGHTYEPCKKKLLFEFDSILNRLGGGSTRIDNLEGMVLWEEPTTKKHYVLFVADNNFSDKQSSQFILFELQGWNFDTL